MKENKNYNSEIKNSINIINQNSTPDGLYEQKLNEILYFSVNQDSK